ncbi:hypothetical protein, partial [Porphyromonas loveana]|uniref:hypothetical protein n=1 Tax=Porphyromonas loveana TaxID=1884669 RepID=UPI0035A02FDE
IRKDLGEIQILCVEKKEKYARKNRSVWREIFREVAPFRENLCAKSKKNRRILPIGNGASFQ